MASDGSIWTSLASPLRAKCACKPRRLESDPSVLPLGTPSPLLLPGYVPHARQPHGNVATLNGKGVESGH